MIINKVLLNKYKQDRRFTRLNQLAQPINQLNYLGNDLLKILEKPRVAIVGSRKVTPYGRYVTEILTKELVQAGVVIISGLAFGVDSIAHQAAIDSDGETIAVLPSGLDKIYPTNHTNLAKNILRSKGMLLTEYPVGSITPMKYQFIARNRIIAALSDAVIITEAAERSGSLHTANFALELGCEVFAVPGNINSSYSKGTNKLIQDGAIPVLESSDILEKLGIDVSKSIKHIKLTDEESQIYKYINNNISSFDKLVEKSKLPANKLNQLLTALELKDLIKNNGNDTWEVINT